MKKINYILLIVISLLFINTVYAKSINIKSIELISKDEDTEVLSDASVDNLSLNINLKFYNTGDFVKYKIIVENNTDEDYVLSNKNIYDENKLIKYEFIFDKNDDVLKAKSKKEFYLNVVYEKEITNQLLNNESNYSTSNKLELSLVKKQLPVIEEIKETIREMVVENPNTTDKILIIVISITIAITIIYILKRHKKTRYLVLIGLISIPFISRASDKITIEINENIEIVKTRMAYNCKSRTHTEDSMCIDWNNYVPYDTYEKDTAYLFTTNTRRLPNSYKYQGVTYNLDKTYDISDLQNEQVMLGVYYDSEGVALLLIGQDNDVNAPIDMSILFYGLYSNAELKTIFNRISIADLKYFDTVDTTDMYGSFNRNENLVELNISSFDTSNVTNMSAMFQGCLSLKQLDLSNFNTSKVKSMNHMFKECSQLVSLSISSFDTSQVTTMENMFNRCKSLESLDVSSFDTSKVTSMTKMFFGCSSLTSINVSNFNTSSVTSMKWMFSGFEEAI